MQVFDPFWGLVEVLKQSKLQATKACSMPAKTYLKFYIWPQTNTYLTSQFSTEHGSYTLNKQGLWPRH